MTERDNRTTTRETTIDRRTSVDDLPSFLTVPELMSYLKIGRTSAYEFARHHGVRIGRLQRVPREVLRQE